MDEATYQTNVEEKIERMDDHEKNALLRALIMKRAVDGLNGREWDSSLHLKWERLAAGYLNETTAT